MANPLESITSLPPKRLALIVGGGIALGLGLRYMNKRKGVSGSSVPVAAEPPVVADTSQLALSGSSTGNLGIGGSLASSDGGTRNLGQIALPVVQWVVEIGGEKFLTDGVTLTPLSPGNTGDPGDYEDRNDQQPSNPTPNDEGSTQNPIPEGFDWSQFPHGAHDSYHPFVQYDSNPFDDEGNYIPGSTGYLTKVV
jgi:hypothetical protein